MPPVLKESGAGLKATRRYLRLLPKQVRIAAQRSINKSLVSLRQITSTELRRIYVIKAGRIKRDMQLRRTSVTRLSGDIKVTSSVINLINFNARQLKRSEATSFKVKRRGGRKKIRKAFILSVYGKPVVIQRGPRNRRQLYRRWTGAVASTIKAQAPLLAPAYKKRVEVIWLRQLDAELDRISPKIGTRNV